MTISLQRHHFAQEEGGGGGEYLHFLNSYLHNNTTKKRCLCSQGISIQCAQKLFAKGKS